MYKFGDGFQVEYGYSDEETALPIQKNAFLQYFCGYAGYDTASYLLIRS